MAISHRYNTVKAHLEWLGISERCPSVFPLGFPYGQSQYRSKREYIIPRTLMLAAPNPYTPYQQSHTVYAIDLTCMEDKFCKGLSSTGGERSTRDYNHSTVRN
jgi:hypothetical protein